MQTEQGPVRIEAPRPVRIEAPRDRRGSFEPQIVKKRQTRFAGFDEQIVAMYGRG